METIHKALRLNVEKPEQSRPWSCGLRCAVENWQNELPTSHNMCSKSKDGHRFCLHASPVSRILKGFKRRPKVVQLSDACISHHTWPKKGVPTMPHSDYSSYLTSQIYIVHLVKRHKNHKRCSPKAPPATLHNFGSLLLQQLIVIDVPVTHQLGGRIFA